MPRSLLWRAFLLIATLMLLAVAAWLAIFREAELEPRARQLAQMISSVVNLTRVALITARPDSRRVLLEELSDAEGVHVYPAEPDDRIEPPPPGPLSRRIQALLQEQLGEETRLAFVLNDEPGLFISFRIFAGENGDFWLALPRERLERHFPLQWLGWGIAVLLLALIGAWLIFFRITRPLKRLEAAARKVGAGEAAGELPERGPTEIVAVTHAFNQMNRSLQQLEEDRKLLLAGISHDLRTPLTRLRMETELSVADESARTAMEADIGEMDRTIGQFLDFARPHRAPPGPIDLIPLLTEIAARYGSRLAGVDFSQHEVIRVLAHADALRRAIVNLIENALRHGGTDSCPELMLDIDDCHARIAILDRGPGIPPAEVERLKQPFTRGESARTGASGAGLGLAIVDRIIRAQGGRFELLPREGGGLEARISLIRS